MKVSGRGKKRKTRRLRMKNDLQRWQQGLKKNGRWKRGSEGVLRQEVRTQG